LEHTSHYWLDLFTLETWEEAGQDGFTVSGFRRSRWPTVQKIKPGNILICYLTKASRFVGALKVMSEPYLDETPIWKSDIFPCRFRVEPIIALPPEQGVPVKDLSEKLSYFRDMKGPTSWIGHFRGSPVRLSQENGDAVMEALGQARASPVERPLPTALAQKVALRPSRPGEVPEREHDRIQWLLLKLGSDMILDVWVARNDRGRSWAGNKFEDIPGLRESLPQQFDPQMQRIVEMIDVLWLRGNSIVCAFEIEHTTSIYSGLLRMSDLLALQPNINIKLYLVAPEDRRAKVFEELARPTFAHLRLPTMCKLVTFERLTQEIERLGPHVSYVKPEVMDSIAESRDVRQA
jgi:predicted RNA-binding protein